ncbi:MAG: indole-3-acetate monooxygenase [Candidatus Binatota bacterium]|nr:indole-3-acetate monooxygenase [Candidatus Binatota bacterium]
MSAELLDDAAALAPQIREAAEETERARRLPQSLVDEMAHAGIFRMCVPRSLGGGEIDPATIARVLESVARADGSAGWCAMIGATSGLVAAYLEPGAAREIYGSSPDVVTGGVVMPGGKAIAVDGGFRVTGRWPFASGCEHSDWLMGGSVVLDAGKPRLLPNGAPDPRLMLFPAADVRVLDTWTVSGLRGSGSHDFEVADVFVPASRSVSIVTDPPQERGPLFAFPLFGLLAVGIAAVALGIGRRAIEELTALAAGKTPSGSRRLLRDRPMVQVQVAEAEATLLAGRALLFDALGHAWRAAERDGRLDVADRASLRLAATHATRSSARAVDLVYDSGGGSSIYASSPLQRCFRDVHVVTQHMMVGAPTYEVAGRVLLGLDTDVSML